MQKMKKKFSEYRKMPWKNGLGTTFEVEIYPKNSTLAQLDFDYRISMALVSEDNEFSTFLGMQRILTVINGSGIKFNDKKIHPLDIVQFNGEERISSGPIISNEENIDLGIIYNPQKVTCMMKLLKIDHDSEIKIINEKNYFFKIEENKSCDCIYIENEFGENELSVEFESGTWISIAIDSLANLPN
jgi:environmental stress-induced protein Ves